jgi:flagellar basal-body rod modification protein FlgD
MVTSVFSPPPTTAADPTAAAANSLAQAMGGGSNLGEDAFLKLLVAQLKNQDPLNPQQNYEFVAQLAQFSSLEQNMSTNTKLDSLTQAMTSQQNTALVSLVGKQATVKGNIVSLQGQGTPVPISFTLDSAAASANITIQDQSGRTIRTLPVGARAAGVVNVLWNGQDDSGLPQPAGPYQVTVTAKNASDGPVSLTQQSTGTVTALSFDQGFPVLHLDNGVTAPSGDLIAVSPPSTK